MNEETKTSAFSIEQNGINVIDESERKGKPRSLFWPWFAANISVLSVAYGAWGLNYGVSFWQATVASVIGIVLSFLLVGFISLAGKRGSAPTLTLSRAAFGVKGNVLPGIVSWILLVGWETVLVVTATLATATVFEKLHWASGDATKIIAFVVVIVIIVGTGVLGFDLIMKVQTWLTIILGIVTVGYLILSASKMNFSLISQVKPGPLPTVIGVAVLTATGLGLGWVNSGADYSRYLPRKASSRGVVGWTTFGGAIAPLVLVVFGLLLVASQKGGVSSALGQAINDDPIGALAAILPTWFLIPFALVAIGSLVSGAVMDIYSSGLTLLAIGLPIKRWVGTCIDGVIMFFGTIAFVWFTKDFIGPFETFLGVVGVPITAWAGIFLGDMLLRRKDYDEQALFDTRGRYGAVNWVNVLGMLAITGIGWGLITEQGVGWLEWPGYLLQLVGLGKSDWGGSGLGVIAALVLGFLLPFLNVERVRRQEKYD